MSCRESRYQYTHYSCRALFLSVCLLLVVTAVAVAGDRSAISEGNRFYRAGEWDQALTAYIKALEQSDDPALPSFNLGDVHYRQQNYEAAEKAWSNSCQSDDPLLSGRSAFNIGNARYAAGDLQGALEAYVAALQNNPEDQRVKYNLEQVLQQMQEQQQEQQNQDQNSDGEQQQEQENQQQQSEQQEQQSEQSEEGQESQPEPQEGEEDDEQQQPPAESEPVEQEEITRRQQEQLLQSLEQDEKEILKELMKKEIPADRRVEKDW